MDDGWVPTPKDLEFARLRGWPSALIETETIKFRNHWVSKPGKDAIKLDWARTWQNWVLNSRTPLNGSGQKNLFEKEPYRPSVLNFGPKKAIPP